MNISIFGLGYVGAVTAGCLAELGHAIIGADVQQTKVDAFNAGESPIIEPELDELLASAKAGGRLSATTDAAEAVRATDLSIVCVGTPSLASGRLNLDYVRKVSEQIGTAIAAKGSRHVVIYRSTMLPGSTRAMVKEYLQPQSDTEVYYCPEFLREGSAVQDFREPSLSVVGTHDGSAPPTNHALELLGGKAEVLSWEGAELVKYSCNYFHALKVGFANEIGRVCKHLGVDGSSIMKVVGSDTKLNASNAYMKPGNPFGGSCLSKDVSALGSLARMEGIHLPLLDNVSASNDVHLDELIKLITSKGVRRIGLLGLAFKPDTDDLRGSPMVAVAETLLGRGYELSIYDPQLNLARLIGANANEIQRRMPHLASLLRTSARDVIERSDVVVASQACASHDDICAASNKEQWVIDVNGWSDLKAGAWKYEGLCW